MSDIIYKKGRENGDLAIPRPLFAVEAEPSVADRCIRAGCGRLEDDDVFYLTKDGGMGENSHIASIIIIMNNDASIAITHTSTDCHRSCCISYTTGAPQLSCYTPAIFITVAILLFCLFVWRTIFSA